MKIEQRLDFLAARRLPVILQSEAAECGLACLAMVSSYHGAELDLVILRSRHPVSLKGMTLGQLLQLAETFKLSGRALRIELDHLRKLRLPAVLHWDLNHFVVLKRATNSYVEVHDPACGALRLKWEEVSRHFTGFALELTPMPGFERRTEKRSLPLSSLWQGHRDFGVQLVRLSLLTLSLQLAVLGGPLLLQFVVDRVFPAADRSFLLALALGFALLAILRVALEWLRGFVLLKLSTTLVFQMAANIMHHILRLPTSYFERRHLGDIMSRFESVNAIERILSSRAVEALIDGLIVIVALAMMAAYDLGLTAVVLAVTILSVAFKIALFRPTREAMAAWLVRSAKHNSNFLETVRASQTIRMFNHQAQRESLWQGLFVEHLNAGIRHQRIELLTQSGLGLFFGLGSVLVVAVGALSVLEGTLTTGMLIAFIAYKDQFVGKALALMQGLSELRMLRLHADRIADIVLTEPEVLETPRSPIPLPNSRPGALRVEKLGYRYAENEPWIFRDLTFEVSAGEFFAITGCSGCGKTTLLKVLAGLLPPTEGKVYFDGHEIRALGLAAYREQIAAVMQEDHLLTGSLFDNITFFDPSGDASRVEACARRAMIHDDIMAMPMGYNTLIGDMGSTLSGGQKQRVLLARALYRNPRLLLLDEATSNLDVPVESRINASLKTAPMTRIVVTHRPDTMRMADRVLCLENGQMQWLEQ